MTRKHTSGKQIKFGRTSRLIQADDVRATPGGSTEHDLHLLTTGKTTHGVVRNELGLKTKVSKVGLDLATNERAQEAKALSLTSIDLENFLITKQT